MKTLLNKKVSPESGLTSRGNKFFTELLDSSKSDQRRVAKACEYVLRVGADRLFETELGDGMVKFHSDGFGMPTYPPRSLWKEISSEQVYGADATHTRKTMSLYVHIPFCKSKCGFCHYVSFNKNDGDIERYVSSLLKELKILSGIVTDKLTTIYVGGGTPTILPINLMQRLTYAIRSLFRFEHNYEFTYEASPETVLGQEGKQKLTLLVESGVTRMSMGVQSLSPKTVKDMNRAHGETEAIVAFRALQDTGCTTNADLMIGMPSQTLSEIDRDAERLAGLGADSIAVYPLGIVPGTKMFELHARNEELFPIPEARLVMQLVADQCLAERGYLQTPIPKHYSQQGSNEFRYLLLERTYGGEVVGAGLSSYSYVNGVQYGNARTLDEYVSAVEAGRLPIAKGIKLSEEELMRRRLVTGIRTHLGIGIHEFEMAFGKSAREVFPTEIRRMESAGMIVEDNNSLRTTHLGQFFVDNIAAEFISDEVRQDAIRRKESSKSRS